MKKREEWLLEWDQVPSWVKVVFATIIWLSVLAVFGLEMEIHQEPARRPAPQDARHESARR